MFCSNTVSMTYQPLWSQDYVSELLEYMYNTWNTLEDYCQTSNVSHTLVGNKIVDHSDAVGAELVGTAPTTSSFST